RQTGEARFFANLVLGHAGFVERAAHAELLCGDAAGTVVAAIVSVGAVGDTGKAAITRESRQVRIELVLAEVAPVLGIRAILGAIDFAGEDDLVLQVELVRDAQRELAVVRRITRTFGRD